MTIAANATTDETDEALLARFKHVTELYQKASKQRDRMKIGGNRDRKSRWCGSLNFLLIGMQSEIEHRGLKP